MTLRRLFNNKFSVDMNPKIYKTFKINKSILILIFLLLTDS